RRAVVFIISDFLDAGYEKQLRILRRRHDIIPIVIRDPREETLPNVQFVELIDTETNERTIVDTSSRAFREMYRLAERRRAEMRTEMFRKIDTEAISLTTGESYVEPLTKYFRVRGRRQ
ncbi:MAG TPA: DUF58 domain-containing protein, partial [Phycisphaerae bacterium]|nr:DUF58 domain-containing protein [Phycisphaerae bacterium]